MKRIGTVTVVAIGLAFAISGEAGFRSTCLVRNPNPAGQAGSPLCDALISFYSFDEASDYVRRDAISAIDAHEAGGQNIGNATGKRGNALNVTGSSTSYVNADTYPFLDGAGTLAIWIYPTTDLSGDVKQIIVSKNVDTDSGVYFYLQESGSSRYPAVAGYYIDDATWSKQSTTSLTLSTWNLLVYTMEPYAGSVLTSNVCISVNNGAKQCSAYTNFVRSNIQPLFFGATAASAQGHSPFTGRIDHVVVAARIWSAKDISNFWDNGNAKVFPFVN